MSKFKILVVDDEEGIRDLIMEYIGKEEFDAKEASNGIEAIELVTSSKFDIVVLDVMMPEMDGWTFMKEIRKISDIPVIMLTARGEEYDRLLGFELGVDDYMQKPFSPKELLARIRAVTRRSTGSSRAAFEGLVVDFDSFNVYVDNKLANLTPKEYELLKFFVRNQNKVFSREQLLNSVWGFDFFGDDRTVDTHVKMLRESLGEYRKFIKTVWGTGYKFEVRG